MQEQVTQAFVEMLEEQVERLAQTLPLKRAAISQAQTLDLVAQEAEWLASLLRDAANELDSIARNARAADEALS